MPFAKNMAKNIGKNTSKSLSGKYSQKRLDHAKRPATDELKTGNLIGNKIAYEITKASKKLPRNISQAVLSKTEIPREKYISPEESQKIIDELRLI